MPTPSPDPAALAASRTLQDLICDEVRDRGGAMPFERFMELALYAPGLGYYSGGSRKFGAGGDFVTAPEISGLFSRSLAAQVAQVLEATGGDVLELGAGSGIMAADVLTELARLQCLPDHYRILELSADLRRRQQALLNERLPDLADRVSWLDAMPERPFDGVILANEVLDAFPVTRFRIAAGDIEVLAVNCAQGRLMAEWRPASGAERRAIAGLREGMGLDEGYASEICMRLAPWVALVAQAMSRGALIVIDYGYPRREYYMPGRRQGTLATHYRHTTGGDVLARPGLQDITAHLDFTALAEAGLAAGLEVSGYTTQAGFLIDCGIEQLLMDEAAPGTAAWLEASARLRQLLMPSHMGERFQVMALTRGLELQLRGFRSADLRRRL